MSARKHAAETLLGHIHAHGLAQESFARLTGVSRSYVSLLCANRRVPSLATSMRMSRVLGLTVEEFSKLMRVDE